MRVMNQKQLRLVHTIMNRLCSDREVRLELLSDLCQRPITTTKELTDEEVHLVVDTFGGDVFKVYRNHCRVLRSTIYHLSMKIDFLNLNYQDTDTETKMMNMAKTDNWLLTHGVVKKKVWDMTEKELGQVVGQMKAIVNKTVKTE